MSANAKTHDEECQCSQGEITHDQTPDACFEAVQRLVRDRPDVTPDQLLGYGMFSVPAPELGPLATKTVYVESISYEECCRRGHLCTAFKWMHPSVATIDDVRRARETRGVCYDSRRCQTSNECRALCWCNGNKKCVQDL
jgi:hypothetical protein